MMLQQTWFKTALVLGGLTFGLGMALSPSPAQAHVFVRFGFGVPFYAPPPVYYGPPAYVYSPPVYAPPVYAEPPVAYAPPTAYVAPGPQYWYYCDNPQGYYPTVSACPEGWREVPATPAPAGQ